jgi:hypothetical protein
LQKRRLHAGNLPHGESADTHADFHRSVEIGAIIGITAAEWLGSHNRHTHNSVCFGLKAKSR